VAPSQAFRSDSPETTRALAERLGLAVEGVPRGGLVVLLRGDLGAGKTVFASGFARGLGVPAATPVPSPTFTVARAYRGRAPLFHLDAYHLHGPSELEAAGFEEMGGDGRVTVVEWGDRIVEALPADRLEATLTPLADPLSPTREGTNRGIEIAALGPRARAIFERFLASVRSDPRFHACRSEPTVGGRP